MPVAAAMGVAVLLRRRWPAAAAFLVVFAVVAPHDPAAGPAWQREVNLILALALGPLAATAVAFMLESLDLRIRTAADVTSLLGLPLLGSICAVPASAVIGGTPLMDRGVPKVFSEAIRGLRQAVIAASAAGAPRRVMITSTVQGEGKSVISSNLAEALGHAEQRTLLIDGDMRRPRVHEVFACEQAPGLSDVLSGAADARAVIRRTANPYLALLPAGRPHEDPAALLGTPQYERLLDELGNHFDWIVVDAPPVLVAGDAVLMADGATSVIFVVGAQMVRPRAARAALARLGGGRARLIGGALNRAGMPPDYAWKPQIEYTQAHGAHRV